MAILRSYGDKTRVLYLVHAFPPEHLHFLVGACCCCSRLKLIQSLRIRCCQWLADAALRAAQTPTAQLCLAGGFNLCSASERLKALYSAASVRCLLIVRQSSACCKVLVSSVAISCVNHSARLAGKQTRTCFRSSPPKNGNLKVVFLLFFFPPWAYFYLYVLLSSKSRT